MRLCHFDRRATKWPEAEKSIKKRISRLRFAAFEVTGTSAFIMYNWYYAVLHAAKAALSAKDIEPVSHNAVKKMFGLHLIKTGEVEKDFARILTAEQENRAIGDYDIYIEINQDRALKRVLDAEQFVNRIEEYLQQSPPKPKKG